MRRAFAAAAVSSLAVVALAGLLASLARDREYRRLLADGEVALAGDRTFEAVEAFSGAVALKPDSMIAYLKRGETYRQRGDLGAALRDLRTASQLDPTATRPIEALGDINLALERFSRAAESYAAFLRLDERSPRVLYKLGLAHLRAGQLDQAVASFRAAVTLSDRFGEAYYLLGLALCEQGRPSDAVAALQRAVAISPDLVAARAALADLYASEDRVRESLMQLEALVALDPLRAERQITLGLAYARAGFQEAAIVTLRRVAERHPRESAVYTALGRVWLESAEARNDKLDLGKAIEALDGVAARASATSETMTLLGRALLRSGDLDGAERAFQQATVRYPVDPTAFDRLGDIADRLGHVVTARDALLRAAALTEEDDKTGQRAARVGELSMRLGEPAVAAVWFGRAVAASGDSPALLTRLAEAEWRAGRSDAALAVLARGLAANPADRGMRDLQARVRRTR